MVEATSIYIEEKFAYITHHQNKLLIFDISNAADPILVGTCDNLGWLYDIYVDGEYGFVIFRSEDGSENGLEIIDISNKESPYLIGSWITDNNVNSVSIHGNYAYIAGGEGEISIIDISSKENPYTIAWYETKTMLPIFLLKIIMHMSQTAKKV